MRSEVNQCKKKIHSMQISNLSFNYMWTPSTFWIIWKTCHWRSSPKISHFSRFFSLIFYFFPCFNVRFDKVSMFLVSSVKVNLWWFFVEKVVLPWCTMHSLLQVDCTPAESHYNGSGMICEQPGNCGTW